MKEEPSDSPQAFDAGDHLMSSILQLKEEPFECDVKDEPTESAFEEVGSASGSGTDGSTEKCTFFSLRE